MTIALMVALAACSEGTAPRDDVSGTYSLVSYDGQPLPTQVSATNNTRTMITGGSITITKIKPTDANDKADYSFSYTSQLEVIVNASGAKTSNTQGRIGFAWLTALNTLTYSTLVFDGSGFLTGAIGPGTLTYGNYAYRID